MKNLFLTLVLTIVSTMVFSQITIKPGVRAGVNFASITNSNSNDKTDFYIGAFAKIKFARFYALQPELNYTRQGTSKYFGYDDIELQYLSLGVVNKFSPFKDLGLHLIIGPAFNIKTGENFNNFSGELEGFDIVFLGGIGYDLPFGLSIEGRYNIGLVDIFGNNINNEEPLDELFLNKVFQIGLSYQFDL
ncbi:porin family protein [Flavivirga aquimarina]|uniref:Porin family protein n=1 Tax=Flavivirga aquimarina TaxID=2027862 RepID=A0ABT8WF18_9FLAO|nr:porin family protein [Flavivirga aquimarina]MDO5971749.1 porin family protein [Flavivirga aquimarina]